MSSPAEIPPRLRVLQCITRLGLGGAERVAFTIMHGLRAEMDFALFTAYAASDDAIGDEMHRTLVEHQVPWFRGTRVPMKAGGMIPGGLALARAVRAFQPDLVHFHSETPEACGAAAVAWSSLVRRTKLVRTIHNSIYWRYWPRVGRWCDHRLAGAGVACVSEAARTEFTRYRRDSAAPPPPFDPVVIFNGVALPLRAAHEAPYDPAVRRVLFAGRFEDQKGTDILCRALPRVRLPDGTRGELTLVGHGAHQRQAGELANRPPPGWKVTVRPPVAGLERIFPEFDLVVLPSRFEGLCLVAVEATLCGVPIVVTDIPGLRETVPADHPWRALPGDAASFAETLGAAFVETSRWAGAVRAAQVLAQSRFSPAAMAAGYREIYARMLQR